MFNLRYASCALLTGALVHLIALYLGPNALDFLGAPVEVVHSARDGTYLAPISTIAIAAFLTFLSYLTVKQKRGKIARLFLVLCAGVFIVRGLMVVLLVPVIAQGIPDGQSVKVWFHVFLSLVVLSIGVAIARGLYIGSKDLY